MRNVLLVEDDKKFRLLFRRLLEKRFDMNVIEAEDGIKGIEIYIREQPRMIFVDIEMPNMNGFEFVDKIKEINKEVPIIVLTNHNEKDYVKQILEKGVCDYVLKTEFVIYLGERISNIIKRNKGILLSK